MTLEALHSSSMLLPPPCASIIVRAMPICALVYRLDPVLTRW